MTDEKAQLREQVQAVETTQETRSRASSESREGPFSDKNEANFRKSETQTGDTEEETEPSAEVEKEEADSKPQSPPLPSHSPLAFANYPPLWTPGQRRPTPRASQSSSNTTGRTQSGFSAATLSSVMSSGSKDDRGKRFEEKDPGNHHQYLQGPDSSSSSHARLNIFGRDIGGLGKPPSIGFRRRKGK